VAAVKKNEMRRHEETAMATTLWDYSTIAAKQRIAELVREAEDDHRARAARAARRRHSRKLLRRN
jgi:hypothetical protein